MDTASPTKRRAALATLDANAMTITTPTSNKLTDANNNVDASYPSSIPTKPSSTPLLPATRSPSSLLLSSAPVLAPPVPAASTTPSVGSKKRCSGGVFLQDSARAGGVEHGREGAGGNEDERSPLMKKSKLDDQSEAIVVYEDGNSAVAPTSTQSSVAATRSRTHSPDASSLFDASGMDDTTATEPDAATVIPPMAAAVVPPVARPRALTREQAREKAEILRLRLGLASYKVRTGQVSIPLADLQARPLPTAAAMTAATDTSATATTVENTPSNSQESEDQRQYQGSSQEGSSQEGSKHVDVVAATPPATTPAVL